MKKRIVSVLMALAMSLTLFPTTAFAAEDSGAAIGTSGLCEHHTAHDEACGYVEGIAENPCTHEHGAECYTEVTSCTHEHTQECYPVSDSSASDNEAMDSDAEPNENEDSDEDTTTSGAESNEAVEPTECNHVCSKESGCIKQELDCRHEHDDECGYAPAVEGQPCTYVCTLCGLTEITAWNWVDTLEVIDPENGVLALSGASEESPTLYDEITDMLPVEISATTEDGTETVSLDSWNCDNYPVEGAYTGSYAFNAVLPEGYVLAQDVPTLTVTVELGGAVMLANGTETEHTNHPICGASCSHNGDHNGNVTWTEWNGGSIQFNDQDIAYVYLNEDIVLKNRWYTRDDATVYLCLNGHTITSNESYDKAAVIIEENSNVSICDCKGGGKLQIGTVNSHKLYGIDVDSGCNLTMYGGTVSGFNKSGVNVSGSFNMYGGNITNNSSSDYVFGGVRINSGATFNMYGGSISGNTGGGYGGGVYNDNGTFRMYGGSISGNTGGSYGGGVYNNGTFEMSGGSITGNTVSKEGTDRYGSGVYCCSDSIIKLSGAPIINNNTRTASSSSINDNLLLYANNSTIMISDALMGNAHIGVNVGSDEPTANNPRAITSGSNADYSSYFSSDDSNYIIVDSVSGGEHIVQLAVSGISHIHNWGYAVDKDTITAYCTVGGSDCEFSGNGGTLTIKAPDNLVYDGSAKPATLEVSERWQGASVSQADITYAKYQNTSWNNISDAPAEVGKYQASIKLGNVTAYVTYEITAASGGETGSTIIPPTPRTGLVYNRSEQTLINAGDAGSGKTMEYSLEENGTYSDELPTACKAGTYTVYYRVRNESTVQSITVTIDRALLTGKPAFTPITKAGKTIADVTLTAPNGWPIGEFHWLNGEIGLAGTTPISQGTSYHWVFIPDDIDNYKSIGGYLVLWAKGGTSGGNSSSTGDDNSSNAGDNNGSVSDNTIPATLVTVPVSGNEKTIQVAVRVNGTTATIENVDLSKLENVIGDDVKTGVVTIDFSVLDKKVDNVKLPANVVKQIAEAVNDPSNDAESLEIILTDGTSIGFDAKTLWEKITQVNGTDITISIRSIIVSTLNNMQQQVVGDRPALDIIVTSGGKHISNMGGRITVYAPYELRYGEYASGIVVYYVDENGNKELCETSYDPVKKRVSWKTTHLSVYMIGYDEGRVNSGTDVTVAQESQAAGDSNSAYVTYTVQKSDTLWAIAKKYGCTISRIVAVNSDLVKNPNLIYAGWQLKIPQD